MESPQTEKKDQGDETPTLEASAVEFNNKQLRELGLNFDIGPSKAATKDSAAVAKLFRAAQKAAKRGNWSETAKNLLAAWDFAPNDLALLTLLAHSLVQLGVREKAIEVLQRALKYHEPTADICAIMLEMAVKMEFYDIAIKIGHQLISLDPNTPGHFVNLASAYSGAERYDEGVELLQAVLPKFPKHGDLWNVLATIVRLRDGIEPSYVFLDEALKVEPENYKALSNYAQSLTYQARFEEALVMDKRAMEANPNNPEPFIGASQLQFLFGNMKEAWGNYARRLDPGRRANQSQIFTHKVPAWKGEDLKGKSLFVLAEQGIGDEVLFGSYLPFLYDQADKLYIGCDKRLISIYQRRFPNAVIDAYRDIMAHNYRYRSFPRIEAGIAKGTEQVDYSIEVGSCPRYSWLSTEDIKPHPDGYLSADPELAETFRSRMAALGDKPKIGLAWRSGNIKGLRAGGYAEMDMLGSILAFKDEVTFVNLQYGDCADELKRAKEQFGVDIVNFEDVNLKQDIEANLAIVANCEFVVAAVTAPAIFSMAVGKRTLLLAGSRPWWTFGNKGCAPFAPHVTFEDVSRDITWPEIVEKVAENMRAELGE